MKRRIDRPEMCGHPIYEGETRCSTCGRPAALVELAVTLNLVAHDLGLTVREVGEAVGRMASAGLRMRPR